MDVNIKVQSHRESNPAFYLKINLLKKEDKDGLKSEIKSNKLKTTSVFLYL